MCLITLMLLLASAPAIAAEAELDGLGTASWIWNTTGNASEAPPGFVHFRFEWDLADRPFKRAFAWATADNRFRAFLNGHELGASDDWHVPLRFGLRRHLRPGKNVLAFRVENEGPGPSPAGLLASVCIVYDEDTVDWRGSDGSWRASATAAAGWQLPDFDAGDWELAAEVARHGDPPWGPLTNELDPEKISDTFPSFRVAGPQELLDAARDLTYRHYRALRAGATMWDAWLVPPSLWPATERRAETLRNQWRRALQRRGMDPDGYVHTHQHFSYAHNAGWPFPIWTQAGLDPNGRRLAAGWHFHGPRSDYMYQVALQHVENTEFVGPSAVAGWALHDLAVEKIDDAGWHVRVTGDDPHLTSPPHVSFAADQAPFVQARLRPAKPLVERGVALSWRGVEEEAFAAEHRVEDRVRSDSASGWIHHQFRMYGRGDWRGRIGQIRLHLPAQPEQRYCIDSIFTVYDTRHPINNAAYIIGACDYFCWTGDREFLRENIGRLRKAMAYHADELGVDRHGVVYVPWVGHGARSGVTWTSDGRKRLHYGRGIGNNYFDLLPFGGFDMYATVQFCAAARALAELEDAIAKHDDWSVAPPAADWSAAALRARVERVTNAARRKFWDGRRGRFIGAIDVDGEAHDYGFTFLNLEAVHQGVADAEQARAVVDWVAGERTIASDTSTGADIYRFRFSPRMTTLRNIDWYNFAWNAPEELPWGAQVQDGGAVLGWSYYDLHARLRVRGPDDAWRRFEAIMQWYAEVQAAGGYRAYYADGDRGALQGGGTAGGLGIDEEFLESALLGHFILDGFMGFKPTPTGFAWRPQLPRALSELEIDRVQYRDCMLTLRAGNGRLRLTVNSGRARSIDVELAPGRWRLRTAGPDGAEQTQAGFDTRVSLQLAPGRSFIFARAGGED